MTIEQQVAATPYNPNMLSDLELYVRKQVADETYSLDVYLALLRMYQFQPGRANVQVMARILIKALMALPAMDFSLCMSLIPDRFHSEDPFATLAKLSQLLETCQFREFWNEAGRSRSLVESVPGFEQAIQRYAMHVLSITYSKVPRHVFAEVVNIEGPSLDKFLQERVARSNWLLHDGPKGQVIELPQNEDNTPSLRKNASEAIPIEQVARLFPILT